MGRLVESKQAKNEFLHECRNHSQNFAHFIQSQLGRLYGLAENIFSPFPNNSFTISHRSLVPLKTDGLLVCEKNISVSHTANGATRLQPVVMNIAQATGMRQYALS